MDITRGMNHKQDKPSVKKRLIQGAFFLLIIFIGKVWHNIYNQQQSSSQSISSLYTKKTSDVMVQFKAQVHRLLPDDNQGSRHQKIIVLNGGISVLVAHNIDLAPRVPVKQGDWINIYGEYEWNEKGGVVHWTHDDPQKKRVGGWIEWDGKKFK